ncbi:MAG: hypothetical protein R3242_01770 [Akkermansiaceae bacterium]|nr:hypothetical protein [Akkermansiaceae bacterium]
MMDAERDDYAANLSGIAVHQLHAGKADEDSQELARQLMALALHLSPRNKQAVVLNAKLAQGKVPPAPATDYRAETMARLLMERGKLLEKQEGKENVELAGYFYQAAVELDPGNEDAIYLSELYRINHDEVAWDLLMRNR